jgi:DNA-directed RNA polymerase subunit E'/Rpb7
LIWLSVRPIDFWHSDHTDQVWVWENEEGNTFYFDIGEIVRLRVEMEEWHDQIPNAPDQQDVTVSERKPPYSIMVRELCVPLPRLFLFVLT